MESDESCRHLAKYICTCRSKIKQAKRPKHFLPLPSRTKRWGYLPKSGLEPAIPSDPQLWDAQRWEDEYQEAKKIAHDMYVMMWGYIYNKYFDTRNDI